MEFRTEGVSATTYAIYRGLSDRVCLTLHVRSAILAVGNSTENWILNKRCSFVSKLSIAAAPRPLFLCQNVDNMQFPLGVSFRGKSLFSNVMICVAQEHPIIINDSHLSYNN